MENIKNLPPNFKVLIVEDSEPAQNLAQRHLNAKGIKDVVFADNGLEAQEIIDIAIKNNVPFSLIMTDINMPEMNGLELVKWLKANPAVNQVPILVVSAEDEKRTIMEMLTLGADQYLIKPYTEKLLVEKINKILNPTSDDDSDSNL